MMGTENGKWLNTQEPFPRSGDRNRTYIYWVKANRTDHCTTPLNTDLSLHIGFR